MDMLDLTQTLVGQTVVLEYNRIVFDARLNRIGNCLGLLHDLLEHKVLVAALFRCGHIPRYGHDFLLYRIAELVHDNYAVRANDCNLVIIQNDPVPAVVPCAILRLPGVQYNIWFIAHPAMAELIWIVASGRIARSQQDNGQGKNQHKQNRPI